MSGKSTLLRAIGVNVVLALAGGTVRAVRVRVSPLAIGATIRVDDSLQEGHSRFYAEILRIRRIVQLTANGPALFLLDEILHGTNSYDRRIGAEAIVEALVKRGAIGLVTTHDLALTELVDRLGPAAANVHFEDRIEDGKMVFDYRMRPGIVEHSNALALMRALGVVPDAD
jgi:DNA mismatch repair ATPase MutS